MPRLTLTPHIYEVIGSNQWSKSKRSAILANAIAGVTALVTGGIIIPVHQVAGGSARRLIGVRGIASDAAHFDTDCRKAMTKATRDFIEKSPEQRR